MTRLLQVELRRLRARRLTRVLLACGAVALLVWLGASGWSSHPPSPDAVAAAKAQVAAQSDPAALAQQRQDCAAAQDDARTHGDPAADFHCEKVRAPRLEDLLYDPRLNFARAAPGTLFSVTLLLTLAGFLLGASSVGADWQTGTLSNLLLFEPRRLRVMGAKAAAVGLVALVLAAATIAVSLTGLWLVASVRGVTTGTSSTLVGGLVWEGLRGAVLVAGAAVAGAALSGVLRHTAAALGLAFGYAIVGEGLLRAVQPEGATWLLSDHVLAWLKGGWARQSGVCDDLGNCRSVVLHISQDNGALYLGVLLAVALAVLLVTFRRRDVA